jgi:hypothetical protein
MTEATTTLHSVTDIATPNASRYLQQLCKHFAHRRPVTFDANSGLIELNAGPCRLKATDSVLTMTVSGPDAAAIAKVQEVAVSHLARFAFREELKIEWRDAI